MQQQIRNQTLHKHGQSTPTLACARGRIKPDSVCHQPTEDGHVLAEDISWCWRCGWHGTELVRAPHISDRSPQCPHTVQSVCSSIVSVPKKTALTEFVSICVSSGVQPVSPSLTQHQVRQTNTQLGASRSCREIQRHPQCAHPTQFDTPRTKYNFGVPLLRALMMIV